MVCRVTFVLTQTSPLVSLVVFVNGWADKVKVPWRGVDVISLCGPGGILALVLSINNVRASLPFKSEFLKLSSVNTANLNKLIDQNVSVMVSIIHCS